MVRLQQQQALNRGLLLANKPSTAQLRQSSSTGHAVVPRVSCLAAKSSASRPQLQCATALWEQRAPYDSDDYYEWDDLAAGGTAAIAASIAAGVAKDADSATDVADSTASASSSAASSSSSSSKNTRSSGKPAALQRSKQRQAGLQQEDDKQEEQQQQASPATEGYAGGGVVGVFVAAWMAVIGLLLRLLQPVVSLALLVLSPLTHASPARAMHKLQKLAADLPEGFWAKLHFLWETPIVKSIRITASVANWGVRLPAIAALLLTQGSLMASQVSLPMLAPLLLGTGMMLNSIKKNASFVFPRLGLLVVLLWLLWFMNSVIQNTWMVLLKQGRIDARTMSGARMITECSSLLLAGVLVLSALGININALLLPTGVVLAIASKDLLQNLIAGLYLVLVQPFRLGDMVAVSCSLPTSQAAHGSNSSRSAAGSFMGAGSSSGGDVGAGVVQGWFEGVCEKVDLRYTVLRDGRRRLMVPNNSFISREFLVYDDVMTADAARMAGSRSGSPWPGANSSSSNAQQDQSRPLYSMPYGASPSPVQPSIREGHMSSELPPLAPPIFPGMPLMPPGYAQYGPAHYAPYAAYPQLQQQQQQQQQQDDEEEAAPDADKESSRDQRQRSEAPGRNIDVLQGTEEQQGGVAEASADGQQGGSSNSSSGGTHNKPRAAKGPPGYLPQGLTAPPPYLGIPVYWPLLSPWGTAPHRQQQQQVQQQAHQPQHLQQQQQQQQQREAPPQDHDGRGLQQPVMLHYSQLSPLQQQQLQQQQTGGRHVQNPWQQQQQQWPQQWQQELHTRGTGNNLGDGAAAAADGSSGHQSSQPVQPASQGVGSSDGQHGSGRSAAEAQPAQQVQAQQAQQASPSSSGQPTARAEQVRPQAVHMAALGGSSYSCWGSAAHPASQHTLDFQQQQQQQYWQAMQYPQHIAPPSHPFMQVHMQMQPPAYGCDCVDPASPSSQQTGSSSSEGGMGGSSADFPTQPGSPDPAGVGGGLAASLTSLQPLSTGMGAASAAAAAADAAMRHLPPQQLGGLAEQAAGGLLGQVVGMCKEVGEGLGDLS